MEASCPPVRVVNPIPKRDLMWREKGVKQDFRHKFSQGDNISGIQVFKICDKKKTIQIFKLLVCKQLSFAVLNRWPNMICMKSAAKYL